MHKIDSSNASSDGKWVAGNPITGTLPTAGTADWFNAIQEEIINYLVSRGVSPSKTSNTQLKEAIEKHIADSLPTSGATGPAGPVGETGPAGPTGPMGPAGPAGASGSLGVLGPEFTTDYINTYDDLLDYSVPENCVVTGLYSIHHNSTEDRRWKFKYRMIT